MTVLTAFPATAPHPEPGRSVARTMATLILFAVSLALGLAVHVAVATPPAPVDRFPAMDRGAAEPPVTAAITKAISGRDPKVLAAAYSPELLQAFQEAVAPLADVDDIRYAGGVEKGGEALASYVATGKDQQGQSLITGFVIHVKGGEITGFN
jgi:hypothetical protein